MSFSREFIEICSSMLLSSTGLMIAGIMLAQLKSYLELIPGMLILIPPLINLKGCVATALASRLGSAFHLGLIGARAPESRSELIQNLLGAFGSVLIISLGIGLGGFLSSGNPRLIPIALIAGSCSGMLMSLLAVAIVLIAGGRGVDPDNVSGPMLTTVADLICTGLIFLAAMLLI